MPFFTYAAIILPNYAAITLHAGYDSYALCCFDMLRLITPLRYVSMPLPPLHAAIFRQCQHHDYYVTLIAVIIFATPILMLPC